ncbi:beta-ketoacyl-ACP synthase II [Planctomycetales bacterium ZRK34]|nr:beta-ketoacyl-ACP synthase II [Planctomycetales bacterium ZRK34]
MSNRRVVITGLGWVTSLGLDVASVWSDMLSGRSGIKPLTRFNTDEYTVKFGGEVSEWAGGPHLDTRDCKRMDRFAQFALSASIDAVNDAGLDFGAEQPERCGVIIGSGIGGIEEFEEGHAKMLQKGPRRVSPFMIPKLMINAASANVSMYYGLTGVNTAAVTACASAGHAITDAIKAIHDDEADVVITGGAEAALTQLGLACFMTMRALSTRNDEPTKASRPWDKDRDGFILSEGAGCMVVEEYEHAKARGANIVAELVGYGMSADAGHITQPDEQGSGAQMAMRRAVKIAGLNLEDINYINAHGTSTPLGDKAENNAIKNLFGDHARKLCVSSTKSMTGHLLGASGGIETIIAAKALATGDIPPTINLDNPDEGCDLDFVANTAQNRDLKYVMTNSFGFGGHNSSLVLGKI